MHSVVFFPVKQTIQKLMKISTIAASHLQKKEPLLILLPDQGAYHFVDELLWRLPKESFLPHPSSYIQLSLSVDFEAPYLFNLRPSAYLERDKNFNTIYELEDATSSEKLQLSQQRYQAYRKAGYSISIQET